VRDPPDGLADTSYPVIDEPPSSAGADHDTVTVAPAALDDTSVAVGAPGAPGTTTGGVTAFDVAADPDPTALRAVTRNEYATPRVNPENDADVDPDDDTVDDAPVGDPFANTATV
jgi:hypothetical protein